MVDRIKILYKQFNADLDASDQPVRSGGKAQVAKDKIHHFDSAEALALYVEEKAEKVITMLNKREYRPSEKVLIDFQKLARQQMNEFLAQLSADAPQQQRVTEAYERIQNRLDAEIIEVTH